METVPRSELAARLRLVLTRSARRLRQESAPGDLGPSLIAALATIERHGPLTPSELAQRERVRRPTATRLIAKLEALGHVQRTPDPSDGRSHALHATPAGAALMASIRERKDAFIAQAIAELDPAEQRLLEQAADLLERTLVERR